LPGKIGVFARARYCERTACVKDRLDLMRSRCGLMFSVSGFQIWLCCARIATSGGSCVLSELWGSKYGDGADLYEVRLRAQDGCRSKVQRHDADDESAPGWDPRRSSASGLVTGWSATARRCSARGRALIGSRLHRRGRADGLGRSVRRRRWDSVGRREAGRTESAQGHDGRRRTAECFRSWWRRSGCCTSVRRAASGYGDGRFGQRASSRGRSSNLWIIG
jgi:hypothetical protein